MSDRQHDIDLHTCFCRRCDVSMMELVEGADPVCRVEGDNVVAFRHERCKRMMCRIAEAVMARYGTDSAGH